MTGLGLWVAAAHQGRRSGLLALLRIAHCGSGSKLDPDLLAAPIVGADIADAFKTRQASVPDGIAHLQRRCQAAVPRIRRQQERLQAAMRGARCDAQVEVALARRQQECDLALPALQ